MPKIYKRVGKILIFINMANKGFKIPMWVYIIIGVVAAIFAAISYM